MKTAKIKESVLTSVMQALSPDEYDVGWICALEVELTAATAMLDEIYQLSSAPVNDDNTYILGRIAGHNVAIPCLPLGEFGLVSAAQVLTHMMRTFPSMKLGLMVGTGGGVPSDKHDIRLGDVVVSKPSKQNGGVLQYDLSRSMIDRKERFGFMNAPSRLLRSAILTMTASLNISGESRGADYLSPANNLKLPTDYGRPDLPDELFRADYAHVGGANCASCDRTNLVPLRPVRGPQPVVHFGTVASGNQVIKDAILRDRLANELGDVLCFEMEAAGLMNAFPCVVIRGICDYADSHKNNQWQKYAAATAAAYAKELLSFIPSESAQISPTSSRPAEPEILQNPLSKLSTSESAKGCRDTASRNAKTPQNFLRDDQAAFGFNVLIGNSLNWDEVALGRLVSHLDEPSQDYYPPMPFELRPGDVSIGPFDLRDILKKQKQLSLFEDLKTLFFGTTEEHEPESPIDLSRFKALTLKLLNSGGLFERLLKEEDTKRWLQAQRLKGDVFFTVALHSIRAISSERKDDLRSLAPGDRIIGARYRKLHFRRFCSQDMDAAYLDRVGCWKEYDPDPSRDSEKLDSLEVTLEDSSMGAINLDIPFEVIHSEDSGEEFIMCKTKP